MIRMCFIFCFFLILNGCANYSNLSKNMVKSGEFNLRGGVQGEKKWEESHIFDRLSWYQELTLYFDLIYTQIGPKSPFYNWFSKSEIRITRKCQELFVVISYSLDSKKISRQNFIEKVRQQGYEEISLPNFEKNLRLHPDYNELSFNLYKIHGFCNKTKKAKRANLVFSGYHTQRIF
jgi:hypothetical protein